MPEFDKARYKAEKLKEELQNVLIMFGMVKASLSGKGWWRLSGSPQATEAMTLTWFRVTLLE